MVFILGLQSPAERSKPNVLPTALVLASHERSVVGFQNAVHAAPDTVNTSQ